MKLPRWFTTPPPSTAWSLDGAAAVAVRRDRRGVLHGAAQELPEGTFELGPIGLQTVDPGRLEPVVRSVQERLAGAPRAAVVLPTGWLRSHLLEFDQLPRKRAEVEDVVRWRLKRLLPVATSELRIAWLQLEPLGATRRLLTTVGLRRAVDTLEATLEAAGIVPGLMTTRVFAVAAAGNGAAPAPRLVIQGEAGFLSLLLLAGNGPRLLRTKHLGGASDDPGVVRRELDLSLRFIRETLAITDPLPVAASLDDDVLRTVVAAWVGDTDGVTPAAAPPAAELAEPGVGAAIGSCRLLPLRALVGGLS